MELAAEEGMDDVDGGGGVVSVPEGSTSSLVPGTSADASVSVFEIIDL